jgi:hypothetical protein
MPLIAGCDKRASRPRTLSRILVRRQSTETMSEVLGTAVEFVAATTRWSGRSDFIYLSGTVWYGMMCRSFLLLERMLRSCVVELSPAARESMPKAAGRRAGAKPPHAMTMGQCLGVLEDLARSLPEILKSRYPELSFPSNVLPGPDRIAWNQILSLRNHRHTRVLVSSTP